MDIHTVTDRIRHMSKLSYRCTKRRKCETSRIRRDSYSQRQSGQWTYTHSQTESDTCLN